MNIRLQEVRKRAGLKQKEMANILGVDCRTYGAWERGENMINLEQAYNCAVILNCSIDEIAGLKPAREKRPLDPIERELVDCYRASDETRKPMIIETARAMRERSGEVEGRPDIPSERSA